MALFEFELKPIKEVMPWGEAPNLRLHWFGLTDGIYYMNVGDKQLFRSSDEIIAYWKKENPEYEWNQPFVDYQVVRLYEDLLEVLADVLQPIPEQLSKYIESYQHQKRFETSLWGIFN